MISTEKDATVEKKPYSAPILEVHGDVEAITLGDDLGEEVDAAFTTSSGPLGKKKRRKNRFS